MRIKQTIILVLAMVVPIGVFIFLKVFGKNQFAVEPLHQAEILNVTADCGVEYNTPYQVPINVLEDLKWTSSDSLTLYLLYSEAFDLTAINNRISKDYTVNEVKRYVVSLDSTGADKLASELNILIKDAVTIEQLKECFFLMDGKVNSVLIDSKRRIRGYYNLELREDADRLLLELKIILMKYQHD